MYLDCGGYLCWGGKTNSFNSIRLCVWKTSSLRRTFIVSWRRHSIRRGGANSFAAGPLLKRTAGGCKQPGGTLWNVSGNGAQCFLLSSAVGYRVNQTDPDVTP